MAIRFELGHDIDFQFLRSDLNSRISGMAGSIDVNEKVNEEVNRLAAETAMRAWTLITFTALTMDFQGHLFN